MTRATRRPCPGGRSVAGRCGGAARAARIRRGIAALLAAAGCAGEPETRRLEAGDALAWIERGGVTRPALVVTTDFESAVDDVAPGTLRSAFAVRGAADGVSRATLALHADDLLARLRGSELGRCERSWPAHAEAQAWHTCEIEVPQAAGRLRLRVGFEGPPGSELLVAAPVFEAEAARARKPPVFVVVLDTARADAYRSIEAKSPIGAELATLARDGILFRRARSPSSWTRPAVATLLTGQSPFVHRVRGRMDSLDPGLETLPGRLRRAGYLTHAWSTNPNVLPHWGFARDFDVFVDVDTGAWSLAKPDGDLVIDRVEAALRADGAAGRMFYLHLMDPHQPYDPKPASLTETDRLTARRYPLPAGIRGIARMTAVYEKVRRYQAEIHETDQQVGRLLALLRSRGEYDDALIAVVSDHGEEFFDHGGSGHGKTLYEEMLHVPLWLKLPGGRGEGTRVDRDVGLEDLAPTILAALGLDASLGEGRDLLDPTAGDPPHLARLELDGRDLAAVVHEGWKLILDLGRDGASLYHLEEDPDERRDLLAEHPERAAALRAVFQSRRLEHERGWHLRACGGSREEPIAFRLDLDPQSATLESRGLEDDDRVEPLEGGASRVRLALPRRERLDQAFRHERESAGDTDELLVVSDATETPRVALRATDGSELSYALGADPRIRRAASLDLAGSAFAARVAAGTRLSCAETDVSYLQIWRVETARADDTPLDPGLAERLRALGYGS